MSSNVMSEEVNVVPTRLQLVYLCGPITGLSLSEATSWRRAVAGALVGKAQLIDPTRDSPDSVRRSERESTRILTSARMLHGRRMVARDYSDIRRSDLVLACFLGAKSVSIGSVGELFWADAMGKPIVIVREEDNPHNHDMLNAIAGWIFTDLDAAVRHIRRVTDFGAG